MTSVSCPLTPLPGPLAGRALVVDDLLLNRVLLANSLHRLGYAVTPAADGDEALRCLEQGNFSVVFLDWSLPGRGGDEVAERIRKRKDAPPIIAITADESAEMRARCERAGMVEFLGKSFDINKLKELLAKLPNVTSPVAALPAQTAPIPVRSPVAEVRHVLQARGREHLVLERVKLGEALAAGASVAAQRALHNLASLSKMLGASALTEAARALELRLRAGEKTTALEGRLAPLDAGIAAFDSGAAGPAEFSAEPVSPQVSSGKGVLK